MNVSLLLIVVLSAQGPIVCEELAITAFLDYTVVHEIPDDFSGCSVIVLATPSTVYEESAIQQVKTFVQKGGGLMLLAEENNKEGTTLVLNQIAQHFSITFNTDRIYDDINYVEHTSWVSLTEFPSHPVFQGVTTLVYTSGCSVTGDGLLVATANSAYSEKYDGITTYEKGESPPCMVFLEEGAGRIFACGDKELFDTYMSLEDNTLFALNVFDWLAGKKDRIAERLTVKREALQVTAEAERALHAAREKGLQDIFPQSVTAADTLIKEAKTLYDVYNYAGSHQKAGEANQLIKDKELTAEAMVLTRITTAQECLSKIEKGAKKYLPSQFEAALYYIEEEKKQKTYTERMEKIDNALALCEEIRTGLKGAAEKEIATAEEKVGSYKGLFGRTSHHSARIYLQYAEESYEGEEFGEAIEFAEESQIYSDKAEEEQKKDYVLAAGGILFAILVVYIRVRK